MKQWNVRHALIYVVAMIFILLSFAQSGSAWAHEINPWESFNVAVMMVPSSIRDPEVLRPIEQEIALLNTKTSAEVIESASSSKDTSSSSTSTSTPTPVSNSVSTSTSTSTSESVAVPAATPEPAPVSISTLASPAAPVPASPSISPSESEPKSSFTEKDLNKKISMNFQDIPVRSALKLLTNEVGLNLVINDSVSGNISLQLNDIPLKQALEVILRTKKLTSNQVGNVLIISPLDEYVDQRKNELAVEKQISELAPLQSVLVKLRYASASDMASLLKSSNNTLLSGRGNVSVDKRTNSIWIQDIPGKLTEIKKLVERLDIPVKQVLIEARLVNVSDTYAKELGIRFGVSRPSHLSGTLLGAYTQADTQVKDKIGITTADELKKRLNFDVTQNITSGLFSQPASIGLAAAKLGGGVLLDMELRAMEDENIIKIVASPRLIISHSQSGVIETGTEIPYQESTSSGATSTTFKKAVLSLKVSPFISVNNKIMLNIEVHQDAQGSALSTGTPTITTQQMSTQVWVNNKQTVVLGGIYQRTKGNRVERIPFLSSIPFVGGLFKYRVNSDSRSELLIFITPKIINQAMYS